MTPDEVPQELIDILNGWTGQDYLRTDAMVIMIAEVLTAYEEIRREPQRAGVRKRWDKTPPEQRSEYARRAAMARWHPPPP